MLEIGEIASGRQVVGYFACQRRNKLQLVQLEINR